MFKVVIDMSDWSDTLWFDNEVDALYESERLERQGFDTEVWEVA